jgi:hypothetical protein
VNRLQQAVPHLQRSSAESSAVWQRTFSSNTAPCGSGLSDEKVFRTTHTNGVDCDIPQSNIGVAGVGMKDAPAVHAANDAHRVNVVFDRPQ